MTLKNGYTFDQLVDNIVGNLIGVLAAFLLFDILYNKLTQDAYAKETSKQITKTLMGDPETLNAFSEEDKHAFIVSTIKSMTSDKDIVDMTIKNIDKHLSKTAFSRVRRSFDYSIGLTTEFPKVYNDFPGASDGKYFFVQEKLNYEVKFSNGFNSNLNSKEVKIGFSFDKRNLDNGLLESDADDEFSKCIFNENLDITPEAIDYFRKLTEETVKEKFDELFTAVLKIDGQSGCLDRVDVRDGGIVATYIVDYDTSKDNHTIRIVFHMPKMWDSIFEVTLVDPTKDPKVSFDYMPGKMDVTMYSYLNKENEANDGAYEQKNGIFDIAIKDEWIYPKSGIVFLVRKKQ